MPQLRSSDNQRDFRKPFQVAQAEPAQTTPAAGGETHAATGHAEHKGHEPGEIPSARLLFMNALVVAAVMIFFALAARKKLEAVPRKLQNFAEAIVEGINNLTVGIIGPGGERFTPLVGTVFVFILLMNLIGQIPGFHSPTANFSLTLALGLVVFVYVQYQGMKSNGVGGHIKHFAGPMPALSWLILPIELIGEIVKPFTLGIRLFGNIFGEDVIIIVLAGLSATALGIPGIPLQFPLLLLALLTSVVQAMVFSILTCIYLAQVTHHEQSEEHGEGEGEHHAAHAH